MPLTDNRAITDIELPDGARIAVRPIRPDDKPLLVRGFDRLSRDSVYKRFLSPLTELRPMELVYLTEVDHPDHEALVAIDEATGDPVGVARYVRAGLDPTRAEFAVTIVDEWQRRGIGSALLRRLSRRAREEGVELFTALLLAENHEMRGLLEKLGGFTVASIESGAMEVEGRLGDLGPAPAGEPPT